LKNTIQSTEAGSWSKISLAFNFQPPNNIARAQESQRTKCFASAARRT
jgi:hypothetical protein